LAKIVVGGKNTNRVPSFDHKDVSQWVHFLSHLDGEEGSGVIGLSCG
jgi:hypothetical protein